MQHEHQLTKFQLRVRRVRKEVRGTSLRPRLHVYRSSRYLYAQIINDEKGITLIGVSEKSLTGKKSVTKIARATDLGTLIAEKAKLVKILKVAFDRGGYRYHGRVRAFAEAARVAGLVF